MTLLALILLQAWQVAVASHYGPGNDGGPLACNGEPMTHLSMIAAHRTMKCGTLLRVWKPGTGKTVLITVMDRGPYGQCSAPADTDIETFMALKKLYRPHGICPPDWKWRVNKAKPTELLRKAYWRGDMDISTAAAKVLGHRGIGGVLWRVEK